MPHYQHFTLRNSRLNHQLPTGNWRMTLPASDDVQLVLVTGGAAQLLQSRAAPVTLTAGQLVLQCRHQQQTLQAHPAFAGSCELITGTLSPTRELHVALRNEPPAKLEPANPQNTRWLELVRWLQQELLNGGPAPSPASRATQQKLCEMLLIFLFEQRSKLSEPAPVARTEAAPARSITTQPTALDPRIERAVALMNDQLDRRWTLTELASEVGLSRSAFARRFQLHYRVSPMAWLTDARISTATRLLSETTTPITLLASQLGYSNDTVFRRAFRRTLGTSPSAYRLNAKTAQS